MPCRKTRRNMQACMKMAQRSRACRRASTLAVIIVSCLFFLSGPKGSDAISTQAQQTNTKRSRHIELADEFPLATLLQHLLAMLLVSVPLATFSGLLRQHCAVLFAGNQHFLEWYSWQTNGYSTVIRRINGKNSMNHPDLPS
jgi:uncharacterized protein involved in response to NO